MANQEMLEQNPISKEVINKLETAFGALAQKIGVGVDHFWPLFCKQQVFIGIAHLLIVLFFLFTGSVLVYIAIRIAKRDKDSDIDWFPYGDPTVPFWVLLTGIGCLIGGIIGGAVNITDIFTQVFNPEYAAIKEIFGLIK